MAIEFVFTLIFRIEQGCENFPRKEKEKRKILSQHCFKNCAQGKEKEGKRRRQKKIEKELNEKNLL